MLAIRQMSNSSLIDVKLKSTSFVSKNEFSIMLSILRSLCIIFRLWMNFIAWTASITIRTFKELSILICKNVGKIACFKLTKNRNHCHFFKFVFIVDHFDFLGCIDADSFSDARMCNVVHYIEIFQCILSVFNWSLHFRVLQDFFQQD